MVTRLWATHRERGASISALFCGVVMALLLVAGLVVDGGAQVQARRSAEAVAAQAARAGSDASAAGRLVGRDGTSEALAAASAVLAAHPEVQGQAVLDAGVLRVSTTASTPTTFLTLVGIDSLGARGSAAAELARV